MFIESFDFELWETMINVEFIHTHYVNGEVIDKYFFYQRRKNKV